MVLEEAELPDHPQLPSHLRYPVGVIRRRWPWMLIALLVGCVVSALFILQLPPRYRATATLLSTSQRISRDIVPPPFSEDLLQRLDAIVDEVLSLERLAGLIEKHGLYPELRENTTLRGLAVRMRKDIDVTREEGPGSRNRRQAAGMVAISFEYTDPGVAAVVANDLVQAVRDASIERRLEQGRSSVEFLGRKVEDAARELGEGDRKISEFKEQHSAELSGALDSELDRLREERQSLTEQIERKESQLAPPAPGTLKRDAERRERAIREELRALRLERAATVEAMGELEARVARTQSLRDELDALERNAGLLRERHQELERKKKDAELFLSAELERQGERVEIVDAAVPPDAPTISRWTYLAAGLAGSLLLSLAVGVLFETLDPVVVTSEQLESAAPLPVLGRVARIR